MTTSQLLSKLGDEWNQEILVVQMNQLSSKKYVDLMSIGKETGFKARNDDEISKLTGMDQQEYIVYNLIKGVGDKGIWIKDIERKSKVHTQHLQAIIKSLERRQMIKNVKSIKYPTRKTYMLYELEASSEVTGGLWYTDQEYDEEFVEAISQQCYKMILSKSFPHDPDAIFPADHNGYVTATDILTFIKRTKLVTVELGRGDIQQILDRLLYDGKITKRTRVAGEGSAMRGIKYDTLSGGDGSGGDDGEEVIGHVYDDDDEDLIMYKAERDIRGGQSAWADFPCGKCPVIEHCSEDSQVSPSSCSYYKKWLQF
ncbi:RNA polymerase Rpc34 [Polychytrium aggregatum]|uniref:RNA polymerase Rpc34 n=1 Tax=Polychytrium aggregatum TaxID=110093 RepID=UPI0022FE4942|nr:RNA polymerase Rpc34 [Polychytrium aggregatum]XP_052962989.1 RNA polymerase Rpc34 [Polychytrium aggregatum]KAI9197325.1 RNA polymerase Rpc34 [Polychytrium aggregatum]KAI9197332.1 RNA polymerase Rpc34 [Polychytrium aggregatum]